MFDPCPNLSESSRSDQHACHAEVCCVWSRGVQSVQRVRSYKIKDAFCQLTLCAVF